jgi:thiamine-monophosphate kinase
MKKRDATSESQLIGRIVRAVELAGVKPRGLVKGIGDDAAVLRGRSDRDLVVTQDIQVEGRHFDTEWFTGRELGWRLAAVNLSDIAAMGARPRFGLFSLVLPERVDPAYVNQIGMGIVAHLARFGAALIGGNVSGTDGPLACDLTLIGECARGRAWLRRARAGDAIVVVGRLGEAAAGLELMRAATGKASTAGRLVRAYQRPVPRLDVVEVAAGKAGVRGAIDVSDGLSTDVIHMCEASGVGCEIDADSLPVSRLLAAYCADRAVDPVEWVMRGGEDYALILSVVGRHAEKIRARIERVTNSPVCIIGKFTARKGHYVIIRDGRRRRFVASGWDHLRNAPSTR